MTIRANLHVGSLNLIYTSTLLHREGASLTFLIHQITYHGIHLASVNLADPVCLPQRSFEPLKLTLTRERHASQTVRISKFDC